MMPVSIIASWRLWAIPLLAALVTGYAVWFVQAVRLDNVRLESARHKAELRSELEAARAAAQEAARAQEQIFQTRIHEAAHAHQQTLARVRADALLPDSSWPFSVTVPLLAGNCPEIRLK